jgi:hypothetical protein
MILDRVSGKHSATEAAYALRILQGSFISFEKDAGRFRPPDPLVFRFPGTSVLNFIIRELPVGDEVDIWMQSQHTVLDGIEVGMLSKRLSDALGGCAEILFPPADGTERHALPCQPSGGRELVLITDFFDFSVLRQLRRNLNRNFAGHLPVPVTDATLLLWTLGNQPEFAGETFALVVDIAQNDKENPRGIDFVVIRPWEYFNPRAGLDGLPAFLAAYEARFRLVQSGRSRTLRTMKKIAMLPPFLARRVIRMNTRGRQRGFGSITITLMKPVTLTLAPISSMASDRATFAFGNMLLPSENGGKVGWVTMKGEPSCVTRYPDALKRSLVKFSDALQYYV